jgi:hypothetical protein
MNLDYLPATHRDGATRAAPDPEEVFERWLGEQERELKEWLQRYRIQEYPRKQLPQ